MWRSLIPILLLIAGAFAVSIQLRGPRGMDAEAEFGIWLSREARGMESAPPAADPAAKEREIAGVAARMTKAQSRQLLQTARSLSAPAAEKVLSTYLLVRAGPLAQDELHELITSPIPAAERESDAVQRERTLRIMALDGLSSRAVNDEDARRSLARVVEETQDPDVKEQARERWSRLAR